MKFFVLLFFIFTSCSLLISTTDYKKSRKIESNGSIKKLFEVGPFIIGTQIYNEDDVLYLKKLGVTSVLSLINKDEKSYGEVSLLEKKEVDFKRISFYCFDDYHLDQKCFNQISDWVDQHPDEKFYIHCHSGARAMFWLGYYLYNKKGLPLKDVDHLMKDSQMMSTKFSTDFKKFMSKKI